MVESVSNSKGVLEIRICLGLGLENYKLLVFESGTENKEAENSAIVYWISSSGFLSIIKTYLVAHRQRKEKLNEGTIFYYQEAFLLLLSLRTTEVYRKHSNTSKCGMIEGSLGY